MESTFDLRFSTKLGRFLEVKKSFQEGDRIFEEAPLLLYPCDNNEKLIVSTDFVCCGCCKVIDKSSAIHCPSCNWYACNEDCAKESWHTEFECKVFGTKDVIPSKSALKQVYLVRSLLLKDKDQITWHKILSLSSSMDNMTAEVVQYANDETEVAYLFLTRTCGIAVEEELVRRLVCLFMINSFAMWSYGRTGNEYSGSAIYAICCLMAHSCSPNGDWQLLPENYESEKRWQMVITACKDINIGQMLTIQYCDYIDCGTLNRRKRIADAYSFYCRCDRCGDPSELETNYSATMCNKCSGFMLPKDPLNNQTDWKCIVCNKEMLNSTVISLESRFKSALDRALKLPDKDEVYKKLNDMVESCEKNYGLYYRHYLVVSATMKWLRKTNLKDLLKNGRDVSMQYEVIVKRAKTCLKTFKAFANLSKSRKIYFTYFAYDTSIKVVKL